VKTVITRIKVQQGQEDAWDDVFRSRVEAAKQQEGFVAAHVCVPVEAPDERLVIGTWETEAAWRAWHDDDAFRTTRRRLEQVDEESLSPRWHDVLIDEHR
jgi:heme-degrading monooxygenase HmoA